jgi:outer membrane protein OmpA-like peptidoglycan-associated protein
MNTYLSKIVSISFAVIIGTTSANAQNINHKLLLRDSLDYKVNKVGVNSDKNEFNPIPYKGGLLFVSNKKTALNPMGFNKVYWIPGVQIGEGSASLDSLKKKWVLNDDFTAPTSNDNNILTHYSKAKAKKLMNSVEQKFSDFNPDQSFAVDDSTNIVVFPKLSKAKINGVNRWELWQATLQNGRAIQERKIKILDSAADYLYPYLIKNATKLYFASNRAGGKGGFDIYAIDKVNGEWQKQPSSIGEINTEANEIYPVSKPDTLLYTSDRVGGMGGYDLYQYIVSQKQNQNVGYPINTTNDDLALTTVGDQYFLTSNRAGSIDIVALKYAPVTIAINGLMTYANDGQLVPNQKFYIFDKDENKLVDSVITDANAHYTFIAKPNRNYEASALNADGIKEIIAFKTNDQLVQKADIALNLLGRSPKQIKDSIYNAMVVAEKKIADSINNLMGYTSKYVVYYGFDKSVLSSKEKRTLDALAAKIKSNSKTYLIVGAFTDCVGSFKYNYALSVKRARYAVQYLRSKGVPMTRFTSNGYSKNYTITPCDPHAKNAKQQINRRAEIVLSEVKNTSWANLEKERGKNYYASVISTRNKNVKPIAVKNEPLKSVAKVEAKQVAKEEKTTETKSELIVSKKSNKHFSGPSISNKDFEIPKEAATTVNKEVKSVAKTEVKTDIKNTSATAQPVIVATASTYNDEYAKEEILKALDSLATLKKEQERIIEYMTKRINKKPIDVFVSSDSVTIEIYDNGIHDKDSVSIIYNNRIIVDKQELKVRKPISFKLKVDKAKKYNELVMVAENLGSEPPNTAVMFVTEKSGRRQQVMLSTDMTHNEVVYFIRIGKE